MELAQESWASYFRDIASEQRILFAAIEAVGRRAQLDERIASMRDDGYARHPLRLISYDQNADVIEVAVGLTAARGPLLRYFIAAPRQLFIEEADERTRAILVSDESGGRTLVCVFAVGPSGRGAAPAESGEGHCRPHRASQGPRARSRREHPRRPAGPDVDAHRRFGPEHPRPPGGRA